MPEQFVDHQAAARSLKNAWTRMASTYRCIQVSLDHDQLTVTPRPALAWLISILRLDLDHAIPLTCITDVRLGGTWGNQKIVKVSFLERGGGVKDILLYLHAGDDFVRRSEELGVPVVRASNTF